MYKACKLFIGLGPSFLESKVGQFGRVNKGTATTRKLKKRALTVFVPGHADLAAEGLFFVVDRPDVFVEKSLRRRPVLALVAPVWPLLQKKLKTILLKKA